MDFPNQVFLVWSSVNVFLTHFIFILTPALCYVSLKFRWKKKNSICFNSLPSTDFRSKLPLHWGGAEGVRAATGQRRKWHQHEVSGAAEAARRARKKTGRTECSETGSKAGELTHKVGKLKQTKQSLSCFSFLNLASVHINACQTVMSAMCSCISSTFFHHNFPFSVELF